MIVYERLKISQKCSLTNQKFLWNTFWSVNNFLTLLDANKKIEIAKITRKVRTLAISEPDVAT